MEEGVKKYKRDKKSGKTTMEEDTTKYRVIKRAGKPSWRNMSQGTKSDQKSGKITEEDPLLQTYQLLVCCPTQGLGDIPPQSLHR